MTDQKDAGEIARANTEPVSDEQPEIDGRTRHYGGFYGVEPLPEDDGRPLVLLWGNCQAEAMRQLLENAPAAPWRTVRIPPVHELTAADLTHLDRLLSVTDLLIAQPVADDYRGMSLGTDQLASRLPSRASVIRWPVLFDAALYPAQVLIRQPDAGDPPVVPYHDLRTVLEAATGTRPRLPEDPEPYRRLADRSREALAAREQANGTVVVSDALAHRQAMDFHTINHPGNRLLLAAAHAVQRAAGVSADAADPGRILLRSVLTPQEPAVLDALGAAPEPGRSETSDWMVGGEPVPDEKVREAHLAFYREHPGFVAEGLRRHAETIATLGWSV